MGLAAVLGHVRGPIDGTGSPVPPSLLNGGAGHHHDRQRNRDAHGDCERERDRRLVERKKAGVLARQGFLAGDVCKFDFAATYGGLGERFIEAHHIVPLAQAGATKTRLDDLALVCSNCHRMLHRARSWISPAQLQSRLNRRCTGFSRLRKVKPQASRRSRRAESVARE